MPSFVWDRDIEDSWNEPYEYEGQKQFHREAEKVLSLLKDHYSKKNMTFYENEESLAKAVWLMQVDALQAIRDALKLTEEKRHRLVSRLLRDAVETMDISAYFYLAGDDAGANLKKWYRNEVIPHREFREFIRKKEGHVKAKDLGNLYGDLSKYTHRTYKAIGISYSLGSEDKIIYDGFHDDDLLVLPHAISFSYAAIAALIKRFIVVAIDTNELSVVLSQEIWNQSLEKETIPRRYGIGPGQILRTPPVELEMEWKET